MALNELASSPPAITSDFSVTSSPHLPLPQLTYRKATESPSHRRYWQISHPICPSSPITPFEGLDAALLAACMEAKAEEFEGEAKEFDQEAMD